MPSGHGVGEFAADVGINDPIRRADIALSGATLDPRSFGAWYNCTRCGAACARKCAFDDAWDVLTLNGRLSGVGAVQ